MDLLQIFWVLQRQAGQYGAGVHVHKVVHPHEFLDLWDGHPHVAGQDLHILVSHVDDYVPVALAQKPGGLL